MKIHVIRSEEVTESFYDEVLSMLGSFRGPVRFIREDEKLRWQDGELDDIDWDDEEYFKKKEIEFSMLENACMASENRYIARWPDIFEKTYDYRCREQIPDDELVVKLTSHAKHTHKDTRGCINDFCKDKRDIVMKMRTGDICRQCTGRIMSENVDPALVRQVFGGFDSIRSHMLFRERYKITRKA
jgi:hypothetical protein